jgi:tRNA (guanine-N7-)-methyltransferase
MGAAWPWHRKGLARDEGLVAARAGGGAERLRAVREQSRASHCTGRTSAATSMRAVSTMLRSHHLYSDAPRLPEGVVLVPTLFSEQCSRFELEIGPGRGGFLVERLASRSDVCLLGLEIRRKWAQIVDSRLRRDGFANRARVFAEDAREAMQRLQPSASFAAVYMHFPDPWWKKRHQKRLLVSRTLLDEAARLLAPRGELFVQTDVPERADAYEAQIAAHSDFEPCGDAAASARLAVNPYGATSHRERRAILDAIPIHRLRFLRVGSRPDALATPLPVSRVPA